MTMSKFYYNFINLSNFITLSVTYLKQILKTCIQYKFLNSSFDLLIICEEHDTPTPDSEKVDNKGGREFYL